MALSVLKRFLGLKQLQVLLMQLEKAERMRYMIIVNKEGISDIVSEPYVDCASSR